MKHENETEARGPGPLTEQDEDVLEAVRAYRSNGVTVEGLGRVQYLNHLNPEQLGASLRRLKARGLIRMEIVGEKQVQTYFPIDGAQETNLEEAEAVSDEETNAGDDQVTTKRRGRKAGAKKGTAKKASSKKRASKKSAAKRAQKQSGTETAASLISRATGLSVVDTVNALEAAYVELTYINQWGEPSPKCVEVLAMLERGRQATT